MIVTFKHMNARFVYYSACQCSTYKLTHKHLGKHTVVVMQNGTLNPFDLQNSHLTNDTIQCVDDPVRIKYNNFVW